VRSHRPSHRVGPETAHDVTQSEPPLVTAKPPAELEFVTSQPAGGAGRLESKDLWGVVQAGMHAAGDTHRPANHRPFDSVGFASLAQGDKEGRSLRSLPQGDKKGRSMRSLPQGDSGWEVAALPR